MISDIFHTDFKPEPYWWERTPRPVLAEEALPAQADVVIIGSGYTGLCAAIETARGGRDVVVLDAEHAGWGCSTRNGGQISTSIKPSFSALSAKFGADHAVAILREGHLALDWIGDFIAAEGIDCDFSRVGRFHAAHTAAHASGLPRRAIVRCLGVLQQRLPAPRRLAFEMALVLLVFAAIPYTALLARAADPVGGHPKRLVAFLESEGLVRRPGTRVVLLCSGPGLASYREAERFYRLSWGPMSYPVSSTEVG